MAQLDYTSGSALQNLQALGLISNSNDPSSTGSPFGPNGPYANYSLGGKFLPNGVTTSDVTNSLNNYYSANKAFEDYIDTPDVEAAIKNMTPQQMYDYQTSLPQYGELSNALTTAGNSVNQDLAPLALSDPTLTQQLEGQTNGLVNPKEGQGPGIGQALLIGAGVLGSVVGLGPLGLGLIGGDSAAAAAAADGASFAPFDASVAAGESAAGAGGAGLGTSLVEGAETPLSQAFNASSILGADGAIDPVAAAQLQAEAEAELASGGSELSAGTQSLISQFSAAQAAGSTSTIGSLLSKLTSSPLGLSSLLSSGISGISSIVGNYLASQGQQAAANTASQTQNQFFNTANANLQPFIQTGAAAANKIAGLEGLNGGDSNSIQQTLQTLPGYQFTKQQGLESTQNSAAARGLGVSGAALKGAANYATGLADSGYSNYLTGLQNTENTGAGAAGTLTGAATATGSQIGNNIIGGANANAAATVGSANAISGAASTIPNYLLLSSLLNSQQNTNNGGL